MPVRYVITTLKPGVKPEDYERWLREYDYRVAATLPSIVSYRTHRIEGPPDVVAGSTSTYANWEVVDPERWVPDGYACVRVDSRGAGRSPGVMDMWSAREARDLYACVEWAARQPWSTGKIGLDGISYYAMNQWQVAALQPPHRSEERRVGKECRSW